MPDPTRETVSASQVAALFGESPWTTRFTLFHELSGTLPDVTKKDDDDEDERMYWGKALEPVVLQSIAKKRDLIVEPNQVQAYMRHPDHALGATVDADIRDPRRGPGIIEAKCSDWQIYKERWTDKAAPPYYELQVQAQMAVTGAGWGVIACLVGGNELHELDREPQMDVIQEICDRSDAFMEDVREGREPSPDGEPIEDPFIIARWPGNPELQPLDLTRDREASELVREYKFWTERESLAKKERARKKSKLLALMKDHEVLRVFQNRVKLNRVKIEGSFVTLPTEIAFVLEQAEDVGDELLYAIEAALDWSHVTRKAGTQNRITVSPVETDEEPAWGDDLIPDKVKDIFS